MHKHEQYDREHYMALAEYADSILASVGAHTWAVGLMAGAFTRSWPNGADNVEVIYDDIACFLPEEYHLIRGDDYLHYIIRDYRAGDRVVHAGVHGTVLDDVVGVQAHSATNYHVAVNWDAEDGGPIEDEFFNAFLRPDEFFNAFLRPAVVAITITTGPNLFSITRTESGETFTSGKTWVRRFDPESEEGRAVLDALNNLIHAAGPIEEEDKS